MKYGFIGCGNMGGALARAVARAVGPQNVMLADGYPGKAEALAAEIGAIASDNDTVARECDYIFMGIKPNVAPAVYESVASILREREDVTIISMVMALELKAIQAIIGPRPRVIRIMPNTPVAVGCGVILYAPTDNVDEASLAGFREGLAEAGIVDQAPEYLMDVGTALTGCGPAYIYMLIEALADGAVDCGLPRDKAIRYAAEMVKGSAEMVLATGKHPGELKDAVTSPGGSTIEGVYALERAGFRGAVFSAVRAGYDKIKGK